MFIIGCVALSLAVVLTVVNILYMCNIRAFSELIKRGMVRVQVTYQKEGKLTRVKGWSPKVELSSIIQNPVSQSSAFVKVYVKGYEERVVVFSSIKRLKILNESFLSVVVAKRTYL